MNTTITVSPKQLSSARLATLLLFLVCGISLASWAPMVPFVKERLQLNEAELGTLLLFLGIGAIISMPLTGILIQKFGTRKVMLLAGVVLALCLPALVLVDTVVGMAVVLFVFGGGIGTIDVSMNAHGLSVQTLYGKHILSSFHGWFSVGGLIGALGLGVLMEVGMTQIIAALCITAMLLTISFTQYRHCLSHELEQSLESKNTDASSTISAKSAWANGRVLFLGCMCFIIFLSEGSVLDWGALFLREERGIAVEWAGAGFAFFSIAMAIMRLLGDGLMEKIQPEKIVIYGSLLGAVGIALILTTPWVTTSLIGFTLLGLGAANIVPILFSKGAQIDGMPSSVTLPVISTLGYTGQLAGPALLGLIAHQTSLPLAFGCVGVLLVIVAICFLKK